MHPVLVEVVRGQTVESAHRGSIAIVDADGSMRLAVGEIGRPVFPRSAVKLLQALPLVASGAADALGLGDAELALACASHSGEPLHAATAAAMLAKAGLDDAALECGVHWPYAERATRELAAQHLEPSALHNNCSGKHAGFLCLACALHGNVQGGSDGAAGRFEGNASSDAAAASTSVREFARGYVAADHPVMREVSAALTAATGLDVDRAPRGVDGCSIPTYAVPLESLALAFARIGTGIGLSAGHARAARRLRSAVGANPFMVAGSGRFDTRVMERLGERVYCKVGAEAVYCAAFPEQGLGVALKIDDGSTRAAEVAMAALIARFVRLDDAEREFMQRLAAPRLTNWNGIGVGGLQPAASLDAALQR